MKGISWVATVLSVVLLPVISPAAGSNMREGLWEVSSTMEMPGVPVKMPPTTVRHCYTKEDVHESSRMIPSDDKSCKMTEVKQIGNKLTWKMECKGDQEATGEGEIVFKGDSYTGSMKINAGGRGITTRYSAKRLGACP